MGPRAPSAGAYYVFPNSDYENSFRFRSLHGNTRPLARSGAMGPLNPVALVEMPKTGRGGSECQRA